MAAPSAWRERLWRRRWWLGAALLLIAVRVALPMVLRRVIESQASQALHAKVSVGDVDLRLWRGGVALEDVAVRAADAPEPPATSAAGADVAAPSEFSDYSPIIAFKRFALELHYLPLFRKTIQLRAVEFESPRLALDHLGKGELNVMALVPKSEVAVQAGATPGADASPTPTGGGTVEAGATPGADASPTPTGGGTVEAGATPGADASPTPTGGGTVEAGATPGADASPTPTGGGTVEAGATPGADASPTPTGGGTVEAGATPGAEASPTPTPSGTVEVAATPGGEASPTPTGEAGTPGEETPATPAADATLAAAATPREAGSPAPTATSTPSAEGGGSGWNLGLDQFVLRDGRLRFRDLAIEDSEPVEIGIDEIHVDQIALTPEVYGAPARIHLRLGVDEGAIDVNAQLTLVNGEVSVVTDLDANSLPLRRARLYVPNVGWSELQGELDLALKYELQPKAKNAIGGTLALRDVAVKVPNLEGVAISWKSLAADIDTVDLLASRAAIAAVALDGALVTVRAAGGAALPWLAGSEGTPPPTPSPTAEDAAKPSAKPWEWSLAKANITDSKLNVLSDKPPVEVGVTLEATKLGSAPEPGHAALSLELNPGTLALEGDLRIANPAFGGTLKIADLALPPLVALSGALPPEALASAKLRTDLAIAAGLPAGGGEAPADRLLLKGSVGLGEVRAAPPGAQRVDVEARDIELVIDHAALPGIIPIGVPAPADAAIALAATLTLAEPRVAIGTEQPIQVSAKGLTLKLPSLDVPGALAKLAPPAGLPVVRGVIDLALDGPHVALAGDTAIEAQRVALGLTDLQLPVASADVAAGSGSPPAKVGLKLDIDGLAVATAGGKDVKAGADTIALALTDVVLPGFVAGGAPPASAEPIRAGATLSLGKPRVATAEGRDLDASADSIALALTDVVLPSSLAGGAPPASGESIRTGATLSLAKARVVTAEGKDLNASADTIALALTDVVLPGSIAGGAPSASAAPIRAGATLSMVKLRVTRGDGKEFAIALASLDVPLKELSLPESVAVPAGAPSAQPIHAVFGEIRIDQPVMVVTRTKEGIVLPGGGTQPAQKSAPAAPPAEPAGAVAAVPLPMDVQVAAVRVQRGRLSFSDRAVDPSFTTRVTPIEIDARNVRYPGPVVDPFDISFGTEPEGEIKMTGKLSPDASSVDVSIKQLPLAPFNSYATAYSPYAIGDGALSLTLKATSKEGSYTIQNDLKLHDLELSGGEDDQGFEKQFGIPMTLALALLRDTNGDIGLGVPLSIDRSGGASVNVAKVVRSALRQAIGGAIQSPLKMLGAVSFGKKKMGMAPAPIAFRRGRAVPTKDGQKSIDRLADFVTGHPILGVQLSSPPTAEDVRWLHEQALGAKWQDENVFRRAVGFVTARGPRERVGAYLKKRAKDKKTSLSTEDKAKLDEWLAEVPPPTAEQLRALAAERLAAVQATLQKRGIDAARIALTEPTGEPVEGKPVARFTLRAAKDAAEEPEG